MQTAIPLAASLLVLAATLPIGACQRDAQPAKDAPSPTLSHEAPRPSAATPVPAAPASTTTSFERWMGQWNGPEGTFLTLARRGSDYEVKIKNLDGVQAYAGVATADHIEFQRDGRTESIRPGSGADTGMKWLADKKDCLVVVAANEGYCRD